MKYEYKTIGLEGRGNDTFDDILNRLADEGWSVKLMLTTGRLLLEREKQSNG